MVEKRSLSQVDESKKVSSVGLRFKPKKKTNEEQVKTDDFDFNEVEHLVGTGPKRLKVSKDESKETVDDSTPNVQNESISVSPEKESKSSSPTITTVETIPTKIQESTTELKENEFSNSVENHEIKALTNFQENDVFKFVNTELQNFLKEKGIVKHIEIFTSWANTVKDGLEQGNVNATKQYNNPKNIQFFKQKKALESMISRFEREIESWNSVERASKVNKQTIELISTGNTPAKEMESSMNRSIKLATEINEGLGNISTNVGVQSRCIEGRLSAIQRAMERAESTKSKLVSTLNEKTFQTYEKVGDSKAQIKGILSSGTVTK